MAIVLAGSKGSESLTVSPDSFDTSYENLYRNEDLCMAGGMGGATVTCKADTTSDSVLTLLEGWYYNYTPYNIITLNDD